MKRRVIIVHGWYGHPNEIWFPWLKRELEKKGFEMLVPQMPDPSKPQIKKWVNKLSEVAGDAGEDTYFVGHSIGCQTIMRFLEKRNAKVGGAVFVAGWFELMNLEKNEIPIAKPWLETPIDFRKVKKCLGKSVAIFSDNDPYVPLVKNKNAFRKNLGSRIVVEKAKGHIGSEEKIFELPSALDAVLEMAGKKSGQ